jgi:hypothetical protein
MMIGVDSRDNQEVYFYTPGKNHPTACSVREVNALCTNQPKYKSSYLADLKLGQNYGVKLHIQPTLYV